MHLEQSNEFELYDICTKFEFKEELVPSKNSPTNNVRVGAAMAVHENRHIALFKKKKNQCKSAQHLHWQGCKDDLSFQTAMHRAPRQALRIKDK